MGNYWWLLLLLGECGAALGAQPKASIRHFPQAGLDNTFAVSASGVVGGLTLNSDPKQPPDLWLAPSQSKSGKRTAIAGLEKIHVVTMQPKGKGWALLGVTPPPQYETAVFEVSAAGKVTRKVVLKNTVQDRPTGLLVSGEHVLVYGTTVKLNKARDGWALLLKDGKKVWERKIDRGRDETFLFAMARKPDWVLIGDSGKLNRFGQGPSRIWILRLDPEGNSAQEAFIDGGRLNSRGQPIAAFLGNDLYVSYTETELPEPRRGIPPNFEFSSHVARFSPKFKAVWKKKVGGTGDPGTPILVAAKSQLHLIGSGRGEIWAKRIRPDGSTVSDGTVKVDGRVTLADARVQGKRLVGLGQVMRFPEAKRIPAREGPAVEQDFFTFRFDF